MSFKISHSDHTDINNSPRNDITENDFIELSRECATSADQCLISSQQCALPTQEYTLCGNYYFSQELPNLSGDLFLESDSTETNAELLESLSSEFCTTQANTDLIEKLYTCHYVTQTNTETTIQGHASGTNNSNAYKSTVSHNSASEDKMLPTLPSEDNDVSVALSSTNWNPRSVTITESAYSFALREIDICDDIFRDFIFKNTRSSSNRHFFNNPNINLYLTFSRAKDFIISNVYCNLTDICRNTKMSISGGMSVCDIKRLLAENELFFKKISEHCHQLEKVINNSKADDISFIMQSKVNISSLYTLNISSKRKKSYYFQKKIKEMLIRIASSLPQKIMNEVKNSSETLISKWLFSECHGIHICNQSLEEIRDVFFAERQIILEDPLLLGGVSDIAKAITTKNYIHSCIYVVSNHILLIGKSVRDYISTLSNQSVDKLRNSLKKSLVLHSLNVINLNRKTIEKMAEYLIVDLENESLRSYSAICTDAAKRR